MAEQVAFFNGEYVPDVECKIHVTDRGLRTGDAVFDVERTFDGKIFRLREHLERLYRSMKYVRVDPGMTIDEMEDITNEVVQRNEPLRGEAGDYWVHQVITRGRGFKSTDHVPPTICIRVEPIHFDRYVHFYKTGAHVVFPRTRAYPADALDPKVKHYSRMNFNLAELEARDVDPHAYPVLLDMDGNVSESSAANFFMVSKGVLRTPGDAASLQGITRNTVLELAHQLGIPTVEEDLQPYDAYNADEAFLTTTSYCILPVGRIDNRPLTEQVPGPVTRSLWAAWSEMVGLDIVDQATRKAGLS